MKVEDIEKIQNKIEKAKTEKIQAETRITEIKNQWRDEFEISSLDEAESKKRELEKLIADLEIKRDKLIQEIEGLMDES